MADKILPVIMCGGAGTRVWPESRETLPKQFIALLGDALDLPGYRSCASRGPSSRRRSSSPTTTTASWSRSSSAEIGVAGDDRHRAGRGAIPAPRSRSRRARRASATRRRSSRVSPPTMSCTKQAAFLAACAEAAVAAAQAASSSRSASSRPSRRSATATSDRAPRSPAPAPQGRRFRRKARARDRGALCREPAISGIPAISSSAPT